MSKRSHSTGHLQPYSTLNLQNERRFLQLGQDLSHRLGMVTAYLHGHMQGGLQKREEVRPRGRRDRGRFHHPPPSTGEYHNPVRHILPHINHLPGHTRLGAKG